MLVPTSAQHASWDRMRWDPGQALFGHKDHVKSQKQSILLRTSGTAHFKPSK